jgi:hypothetical protein
MLVHYSRVTSTGKPGDENTLAGDFGESWLESVAAGCGLLHGRPTTLDLEKADVELVLRAVVSNVRNPHVKVQVKTTHELRDLGDGNLAYDLDVETYEVLRQTDHSSPRILAVIRLSDDGERVRLEEDGTLLVGQGAWVSLAGEPASTNTTSQVVHLPSANTLDPSGLRRMITEYGVRTSTLVPEIDPWKGAP